MRPEFWLGVGLRRLGTLTGILHVRDEEQARLERHGGDFAALNERMAVRAEGVLETVARYEARI